MAQQIRRILIGIRLVEALRDVLQGVTMYIKRHGRDWRLQCVDADEFLPMLRRHAADGAITVASPAFPDLITRLAETDVPTVNLFHNLHPRLASVLSDDKAIGASGAAYLMRLGFKNFAFLGIDTRWSHDRQEGFTRALAAGGLAAEPTTLNFALADYRMMEGGRQRRKLQAWVKRLPKPVAAMVASDQMARAMLLACEGVGARVPQDVAILGVDNLITTCELASVPLSSVAQDFPRLGFEAARTLDRLLDRRKPPAKPLRVPPGPVVVRRSTDVLAFDDEYVSSAMRLIHERASEGITVKQLVRQVPVSRKWLDLRFKALVGHTPSEEIRRLRVAQVQKLLLETDLSVQQIANRCAFSCSENLIRFFRDATGLPPQTYRLRHSAMRKV